MRILIITHYFPPLNSVASMRPYSWAKYWSRAGHHITLLTTKKYPFDGPLDLGLQVPKSVQMFELAYMPAFLGGIFNKLRSQNQMGFQTGRQSFHWTSGKKIAAILRRKLGSFGDTSNPWIAAAIARAGRLLQNSNFDVMVSTFGPPATHVIASILKRKFIRTRWVADYRDLWSGNHLKFSAWPISSVETLLEKAILSKCDLATTISKPLADHIRGLLDKPVEVIENGFDPEEYENLPRARLFPEDGAIRLVYTGTIYPGKRDPSPIFKAVKSLERENRLRPQQCRLLFFGSTAGDLQNLVKQYEVEEWVDIKGHVDRPTALMAQRDADGLLFLEWNDPSARGVLTGKIFEYIRSGRPILGIGIDDISTESGILLKRIGNAYCLGTNVERLKEAIIEIRSSPKKRSQVDTAAIQPFRRDLLALRYLDVLQSLNEISPKRLLL